MKNTPICDLSTKKWLNLTEAIIYLGFGSKNTFQQWREKGLLAFYKPGNTILYKRTDLDKFVEKFRQGEFSNPQL
jgi:excisionase family DNA binding protein